jgi:hypothetical protein
MLTITSSADCEEAKARCVGVDGAVVCGVYVKVSKRYNLIVKLQGGDNICSGRLPRMGIDRIRPMQLKTEAHLLGGGEAGPEKGQYRVWKI